MKTRCQIEDLRVDEITVLPLTPAGRFSVYRLEKTGWSTITLLVELAKKLRLPLEFVSYGGRLERNAVTSQHIAFESKKLDDVITKSYQMTYVGRMDRPMAPDLIKHNEYRITVRDLTESECQKMTSQLDPVRRYGFANYYDDLKFTAYDPLQGFFGEKILLGHMNGAAKVYLTGAAPDDSQSDRDRKAQLFEHWKDWKTCLSIAATPEEKSAFHYFIRKPDDFLGFLFEIPREEALSALGAYQAFIWNETLRRYLLSSSLQEPKIHPGVAGDYVFYQSVLDTFATRLSKLRIPTLASKMEFPDVEVESIHEKLMQERGIERSMFNKTKYRHVFFKSTLRSAVAIPGTLTAEVAADSLHAGKKSMTIHTSLPYGSYSAMLLKRLIA